MGASGWLFHNDVFKHSKLLASIIPARSFLRVVGKSGWWIGHLFSRPQDESDDFEALFCVGQQLLTKSLLGGFNNSFQVPVPGMINDKAFADRLSIQPPSYLLIRRATWAMAGSVAERRLQAVGITGWRSTAATAQDIYGSLFVENDPKQPPFPQPGTDHTIAYFLWLS